MQISAPRLRVIDADGTQLGEISLNEALARAREKGLDLLEVSPQANPPVAKIVDYGAYKFQKEKQERKQKAKQKKVGIKGIRLSMRIDDHDFEVKVEQATRFLKEGHKVKIELVVRGREAMHLDLGRERINEFIKKVGINNHVEMPMKKLGNRLTTIIASN
jgi:translation initiation factor IF-3